MKNTNHNISRRRFLKQASCAALGSTGVLSTLFNLRMANIASAQTSIDNDYKALVCLFLAGGNDSYNMLVPTEASEYANYQAVRGSVALPTTGDDALLPINALDTNGRSFAIHPAMPELQALFNSGNVAFVSNVGTLVEPTTMAQFKSGSVSLPRALFSHNDQITQWQTVMPQIASPTGWTGRIADVLTDPAQPQSISMNISLAGNNIMQVGATTTHYSISSDGAVSLDGKHANANSDRFFRYSLVAGADEDDVTSLIGQSYQNLFERTYLEQIKQTVEMDRLFADSYATAAGLADYSAFDPYLGDADVGDDELMQELQSVAQMIAARDLLGAKRQVFMIVVGGWDHHDELLGTQHVLLGYLSRAMKAFWDTLGNMGMQDNVLTFTSSDFGRTLRTNGRGTDHAWGGNHMIMGGAPLNGQRVHGTYPEPSDYALAQGLDVGSNGRMLPTTSVDQYVAEMALWLGVDYGNLEAVLPNITNFYTPGSTDLPIGYIKPEQMPPTAFSAPTSAVTMKEAQAIAQSDQLDVTKTGLIVGAGAAATAAMIALRERRSTHARSLST